MIPPGVYVLILLVLLVGGGYWYVDRVLDENAALKVENSALTAANAALEAEAKVQAQLQQLENERLRVVMDRQSENAVTAERERQRVSTERLTRVSLSKAKRVEKLAHAAIVNNREVLSCLSDLRADPAACGAVR